MVEKERSSEVFHNTWLFSEDSFLSKCPSRSSMTVSQDLKVRESIHSFLLKLGSELKLDGRTILAATVYLNRLYMRIPITTSKYFVVCAAVAISCKLHDTYRAPDKIALTGCAIKNPGKNIDQHSGQFWEWRDQLIYREELILKLLNFELDVELPYDLVDGLLEAKNDSSSNGFYIKLQEILKNTVAKIELLSALPILVSFDMRTLFGTMLVLTVREAQIRFEDLESIQIPPQYLKSQLHVSIDECYYCYKYILKLKSICEDAKLPSHKGVAKNITVITKEQFRSLAKGDA